MKTFRFISVLLAAIAVLTSCNEDVVIDNPVSFDNNTPDDELVVEIDGDNSQGAQTRVAYSGWATSFETGDQIGIYCWNGTSVVASNVPFTKQSNGTWTTATNTRVPYNASYTYFCYFPYNASHGYTPGTSGNADTRFETFITDASNRFWKADQSTKANYDASNLMIGAGSHVGSGNKVSFAMDHKRGLALFTGDMDAATFTGNIPYLISDTKYFLMKPSTSTSFTDDEGSYSLSAASGKYVIRQIKGYFRTILEEAGSIQLIIPANVNTTYMTSVSYSTDAGSTWTTTNNTSSAVTITTPSMPAGSKILWKGIGQSMAKTTGSNNYCNFTTSSANFSIRGNIMSLLFGDDFVGQNSLASKGDYTFYRLFRDNTKLNNIDGVKLPATTLKNQCYREIFSGCSNLTLNNPDKFILPADRLTSYCYCAIFENCTKLTAVSKKMLPATKLAEHCYDWLFAKSGLISSVPELPATTMDDYCYRDMFYQCTALTTAPELPATDLSNGDYCYDSMFRNCTALTTAPKLPATKLSHACYIDMFSDCTALTTALKLPATTLTGSCYYQMFYNCKSLTTAPELPATTLVSQCYMYMFYNCTSLNCVKAAFTTTPVVGGDNYTTNWLTNVASVGTFYKNSAATWTITGTHAVPSRWTVITYTP